VMPDLGSAPNPGSGETVKAGAFATRRV